MRQNAVSYSVYDLLDVTAHEDNLDKLEVYALYDSGRNDCTGSISADGSSLSFPDYGVYDMHVKDNLQKRHKGSCEDKYSN